MAELRGKKRVSGESELTVQSSLGYGQSRCTNLISDVNGNILVSSVGDRGFPNSVVAFMEEILIFPSFDGVGETQVQRVTEPS
jgi:hypothetical protein